MKEIDENFASCVILYNPDPNLEFNISQYLKFVDRLYIIDNSSNDNSISLSRFLEDSKISYIKNDENLGIAEGLNIGCSLAFREGYKWLLTMDQDSYIKSEAFFMNARELIKRESSAGIIAASYLGKKTDKETTLFFYESDFVITSGNLLNLDVWDTLKGFDTEFFIDEVDHEFCIRLKNKGYKIFSSFVAYLFHSLGEKYIVKDSFIKSELELTIHSPLRVYYMVRNNLVLWKRYLFSNPIIVGNRIKHILYTFIKILRYYPNKEQYFLMVKRGIIDFCTSKYGKFK